MIKESSFHCAQPEVPVQVRLQTKWSDFVVRWGCASGSDSSAQKEGILADMPVFVLTDPDNRNSREAAWLILDAYEALRETHPKGLSLEEVSNVWRDLTQAIRRRAAERTIISGAPEEEEVSVACLFASRTQEEAAWIALVSGNAQILEIRNDGVAAPLDIFAHTSLGNANEKVCIGIVPMQAGQRFVLATARVREYLKEARHKALTQLVRAERVAAAIIARGHYEDESEAVIVTDVMTPARAGCLESPPTLAVGDCEEAEYAAQALDSAMGLRALGVDDSSRRRHIRRTHTPPPELSDFRFVSYLGSGGFSDVYLYEEQLPKRLVAIKVLAWQALAPSDRKNILENASQFRAEVDLMAQLSGHPSVVTIHDAAVAPSGQPYVVMQYCPMPSLAERIAEGPMVLSEALKMGVQMASAVHTAHVMGIVHHDLKPANVLYSQFGRPLLGDFGIASLMSVGREQVAGVSLPWAAPEVVSNQGMAGALADVYSLAATVYTALEGRAPFPMNTSQSRVEFARHIAETEVPLLATEGSFWADIPREIKEAVRDTLMRGMKKNPIERTPSAAEFGRDLQRIQMLMGEPVTDLEIPCG